MSLAASLGQSTVHLRPPTHLKLGLFLLAVYATLSLSAQTSRPAISHRQLSTDSSTIVATWTTQVPASSGLACGTVSGAYDIPALDNGLVTSATAHESIVAGLRPATNYFCKLTSSNAGGAAYSAFKAATTAPRESTPATGVSFGPISPYNAINPNNTSDSDTFYNACLQTGCFLTNDDTRVGGFRQNGLPKGLNAALSLAQVTSTAPFAAIAINPLSNYGPCCKSTGDDRRSEKDSGLFAMNGTLYMAIGRQENTATTKGFKGPAFLQSAGQIVASRDRGKTWNNFQNPSSYSANGSLTSPASASMLDGPLTTAGSATFVMYCADDGTLGYTSSCNRVDNANAYVYLWVNEGAWNGGGPSGGGGNAFYVARVARAKIGRLSASDYEWYTGGDGSLATNWSSSQTGAAPVIENRGALGEPNVQYIPALNSYLVLTFYYPKGIVADSANTTWLTYTCPHPWGGGCTLIDTSQWPKTGYYNPVILTWTAWQGSAPTIAFTGNFNTNALYQMFLSVMTILH